MSLFACISALVLAAPAVVLPQSWVIDTVAGPSLLGGDGKPATSAQLGRIGGLAVDTHGNLYISDTEDRRVRKVSPDGIINTAVGISGSSFAPGASFQARVQLQNPGQLALDRAGNLYVADQVLYKITAEGSAAGISLPYYGATSVALDGQGNLYYVGLQDNFGPQLGPPYAEIVIMEETPRGAVRTVGSVGTLFFPYGPPLPQSVVPTAMAADSSGNIGFLQPKAAVKLMHPDGSVTRLASQLQQPAGLAFDRNGNLYVSDIATAQIWRVSPAGALSVFAGSGTPGLQGDGGPASAAQFWQPGALAFDSQDNLYVADTNATRVRRISTDGTIATIAGQPRQTNLPVEVIRIWTGDGKPFLSTLGPNGITFDASGTLYIAGPGFVFKLDPAGDLVLIAGIGDNGSYPPPPPPPDGTPAVSADIRPTSVAVDSLGDVFFSDINGFLTEITPDGLLHEISGVSGATYVAADREDNLYFSTGLRVGRIAPDGRFQWIAGSGVAGFSGDGGPAAAAQLNGAHGLAFDASGNVYIADTGNGRIRKVDAAGIITTVLSGLYQPVAVRIDSTGNLFIADGSEPATILRVDGNGVVERLTGSGSCGVGDGGLSVESVVCARDLAVDSQGNVYVAGLQRIRKLTPVPTVLSAASLARDAIAPGEVIAIRGSDLGPEQGQAAGVDESGKLKTEAGGTQVFFNGIPAPLLYVSSTQINAVAPYEVVGHPVAQFEVQHLQTRSAPVNLRVSGATPAIFTLSASGDGQAAALNQDRSVNRAGNPEKSGSIMVLYATGGGTLTSSINGEIVSAGDLPQPVLPVSVAIDGLPAELLSAAGAPGVVSGVLQINVRIPERTVPGSAVPVLLNIGGVLSPGGVTIAVQ